MKIEPNAPANAGSPAGPPAAGGGSSRWPIWLILVLLLMTAIRVAVLLFSPADLSGDEAQYWDWSRHPDWCYFSKGPMVAWIIWVGRLLLGETVLAVRLPAVALSAACSVGLYLLGRRLYNGRIGEWAAILFQVTPIFAIYGIGMTIDPPLLLCWILALLFFHRALERDTWGDWIATGVAVGAGLLSKYTMAFFYPCALAVLVLVRANRRRLASGGLWVAVAISLAMLVPLLIWNSQHGWVNFQHNAGHTRWQKGLVFTPAKCLEFIAGQLAVITPVLAIMAVWAIVRRRRDDPFSFWFCAPILAFFLLKSLQGEVYANWPDIAYLTSLPVFVAYFIERYRQSNIHARRLTRTAVVVAVAATGVVMAMLLFFGQAVLLLDRVGLPHEWNPHHKLAGWMGWPTVGRTVDELREELARKDDGRCFVVAERRLVTARLAFYTPSHPAIFQMPSDKGIASQYHLWRNYDHLLHWDAVCMFGEGDPDYVADPPPGERSRTQALARLARLTEARQAATTLPDTKPSYADPYLRWDCWAVQFDRIERRDFNARDGGGQVVRPFTLYVCHDFLGGPSTATSAPAGESAEE